MLTSFFETIGMANEGTSQLNFNIIRENLMSYLIGFSVRLLIAVLALIIGLRIIKYVVKILKALLEKSQVDGSVSSFLLSLASILMKIVLFLFVLTIFGFAITSFLTILGAAGLAVGLALQGSLSNFAGGVLILILKPFQVGDFIEGGGNSGTVESIDIFYTTLKMPDNKVVVIPNGTLSNNSIINYSKKETRRLDLTFGVGYKDDIFKVKEILTTLVNDHELILDDPEPMVRVSELNSSSVDFLVRVWCKSSDFWPLRFELIELVKLKFDEEKVNIPYPQMDVHLIQPKN
ncbi:small conductance mechanosensitive channel [Natranaerovirga pectinivora]|uniref:Small conductance mechanosensitive channel n=1 Tax=Natranaerovirga pectinivora TaxID=682400 RepID=A0A4R3MMX9_9FIRM|nr:mechanosensitive ion channel domain-containing protein [Natranaerovirga pectinivora]TCT16343.1 small conductance mechanosensitive channel [Natranaerovirga pectinivora]